MTANQIRGGCEGMQLFWIIN